MTQIMITEKYTVATKLGIEAMITRGCGPAIIDKVKKTPAAAQFWSWYKETMEL